ncbi:MAG: lysostaphin resistance A-like protein [Akkermansia sp.]
MLPLYGWLCLACLLGSGALCVLVYALGRSTTPAGEAGRFPTRWDVWYTALFGALLLLAMAFSLPWGGAAEPQAAAGKPCGGGELLLAFALQWVLYVPMVWRCATLPRCDKPLGFLRAGAALAGALAAVYIPLLLLQSLGWDAWIIEWTHCPPEQEIVSLFGKSDAAAMLVIAVAAVLGAPVVEECCFRGFLYRVLRRRAGMWPSALASGFLFGAIHLSLVQMLPLSIFGVVQCILLEKTGRLWLPMILHALFNLSTILYMMFFP